MNCALRIRYRPANEAKLTIRNSAATTGLILVTISIADERLTAENSTNSIISNDILLIKIIYGVFREIILGNGIASLK